MKNETLTNTKKIWSPQFVLVLVGTAACNITMTMMMPIMPMYLGKQGLAASLAGVVVGIFTFAALTSRPLWGKLLDAHSRRLVFVLGGALATVMCFAYQFANGIALLLAMRIVHGFGYAAVTNATGTIAADLMPPERRSEGLGYYGVAFAASLALGPALALQIVHSSDIVTCFMAAAAIAFIGLICSLAIQDAKPALVHQMKKAEHGNRKLSMIEQSALPASVVMLLVALNYSAVVTFVPSYAISQGLGGISVFFVVYAITLLICRVFIGKYTDRHGLTGVLLPGILLMAVSFVTLAFARTEPLFILAAVLFGGGYGTVQPTLNAIVIARCAPLRRGAANATFFAAMDLGIGIGAMVWGFVSASFGYPSMYGSGLLFFVAAAFGILLLRRKSAHKDSKPVRESVKKIR